MKTQEEIEQLADNFYPLVTTDLICSPKLVRDGYFKGYIQCQEDMQKDVEYWQGEFDHWHQQAMEMADKYNELLNKQDNEKQRRNR